MVQDLPETTMNGLQMAHSAGSGGATTNGLDGPLVGTLASSRIAT